MPKLQADRDRTVDILRGLAIFTMAAANSDAYALAEPHPFWIRLYGSFAAPIFIVLSGNMVHTAIGPKGQGLRYVLSRSALILGVAVLIDLLNWHIMPFTTVDVLYLIALSFPLLYGLRKLIPGAALLLAAAIFILSTLLQRTLGYCDYPTEYYLSGQPTTTIVHPTAVWQHWLLDGWFPLLPWFGFSLLGYTLGRMRKAGRSPKSFLAAGSLLIITGIASWIIYPGTMLTRGGYSELFYPPSLPYMACASGLILLLFFTTDRLGYLRIWAPLELLGQCSLLMYILHLVLIASCIQPLWPRQGMPEFLAIYALLLAVLFSAALLARLIKARAPELPYPVKFLIGS